MRLLTSPSVMPSKRLEVTFFNSVVESALMSLQERLETMTQVREKF